MKEACIKLCQKMFRKTQNIKKVVFLSPEPELALTEKQPLIPFVKFPQWPPV